MKSCELDYDSQPFKSMGKAVSVGMTCKYQNVT